MSNSLSLIKNIVVLMLENRSFDTILGTLYPYSAQFEGLKLDGSMANTYKGLPYPVTNRSSNPNPFATPPIDPGESFTDMNLQIFNTTDPAEGATANMAGFVNDWMAKPGEYPEIPTGKECLWAPSWPELPRKNHENSEILFPGDIMFYYTLSQLPVTSVLAQSFGVSDAWFGSCPTQTYPNRFFLNCATSGGYVDDVDYLCNLEVFPNLPSIFELLDGEGGYKHENWKVYFHDFPVSALIDYVWKSSEGMVCSFDTSDYGEFSLLPTFASDVQNNKLPKYSFIEPRYGGLPFGHLPPNDNHPPFDVRYGEVLLGTVYNLLRGSSYWPQTLLIVTYDEHGGCFDHVIPPPAVEPGGTELRNWHPSGFTFNRYGPRVPAILVSPYIRPGCIVRPAGFSYLQGKDTSTTNGKTPFDHTSVIRTIVECFHISNGEAYLTNRDKQAPSLADALSLHANHMNNGPSSVELPGIPVGPTITKGLSSHLADIYVAAKARMGAAKFGHHLAVWSRRNQE